VRVGNAVVAVGLGAAVRVGGGVAVATGTVGVVRGVGLDTGVPGVAEGDTAGEGVTGAAVAVGVMAGARWVKKTSPLTNRTPSGTGKSTAGWPSSAAAMNAAQIGAAVNVLVAPGIGRLLALPTQTPATSWGV
jgi:hypothetical protein